jgi:hypothetical protein
VTDSAEVKRSGTHSFGAYRKASYGIASDLSLPASSSAPQTKSKVPWFREIGITSDPIEMKRIWSPHFEYHYETRKWGETYKGRLVMRAVSRFFVGTAFYATAQLIGNKAFANNQYVGEKPTSLNPLHWAAYGIDKSAGDGIKFITKLLTGSEEKAQNAVMFRDTRSYGYKSSAGKPISGRSLGHDAVTVTFDFAAMSFGDYMTRYVIGLFDPHATTKWIKAEPDGHKHFDLSGGLKELAHTLFRAVTYAAGEDMFVALPYVYYMKFQRNVIDRFSPGFKYDSDAVKLGGSLKVGKDGKPIGNYELESIIDLTGRFSIYNVMTKMFRDLYGHVENQIDVWRHGIKPEQKERLTIAEMIGRSVKYVAVTTTKVLFFMIPSAFLFGVLRTPTGKPSGLLINPDERDPDKAVLGDVQKAGYVSYEAKYPALSNPDAFTNKIFNEAGTASPAHNIITNPIGKTIYGLTRVSNAGMNKFSDKTGIRHQAVSSGDFARIWANAAIPYTPYFMLKSDIAAPFLDTNRSNFVLGGFYTSLWGTLRSLASLNGKRIKAAWNDTQEWAGEVCLALLKQPSPKYEPQIQKEMNDEGYKLSNEGYNLYQEAYERRKLRHELRNEVKEELGFAAMARPTYVQLQETGPKGLDTRPPSHATRIPRPAPFSPASVIQERQQKGADMLHRPI